MKPKMSTKGNTDEMCTMIPKEWNTKETYRWTKLRRIGYQRRISIHQS